MFQSSLWFSSLKLVERLVRIWKIATQSNLDENFSYSSESVVATSGALVNPSINAILALKLQLSFLFQIIVRFLLYYWQSRNVRRLKEFSLQKKSEEAFFKSDALL